MTNDGTVQQPSPETATGSLASRQHDAVAAFVAMQRGHGALREEIDRERERALDEARDTHDAALRGANETAESGRERTAYERQKAVKKAESKHAEQADDARAAHEAARGAALERLDTELSAAEEKLRDAAWLAEASFEGGSEQPKVELERVRGIVSEELGKLDTIEAHARRLAGPRVEFPDTAPPEEPGSVTADLAPDEAPIQDPSGSVTALQTARETAHRQLGRLRGVTLHAFVRNGGPIVLILLGCAGGAAYHLSRAQLGDLPMTGAYTLGGGVVLVALMWPVRALALLSTRRRVQKLAASLREARTSGLAAVRDAERARRRTEKEIKRRKDAEIRAGRKRYETRLAGVKERREQTLLKLDRKHVVISAEITKRRTTAVEEINTKADAHLAEIERAHAEAVELAKREMERAVADAERAHAQAVEGLERRRADCAREASGCVQESAENMRTVCPAWGDPVWPRGPRPLVPAPGVRIGSFTLDLPGVQEAPAMLDTPSAASLIARAGPDGRERSLATLRNAMLRSLTALPAGKVRFTMLDPVGLGQSFAGFMRLADHDERLVDSRIWTEARQIEQRLTDITGHMETVIQKYLRNEFASIDDYNEKAGEIAEPYRFLVVADFPTGFTEESARRLVSIIESGPRCGVFVLMHQDTRGKLPETITQDDLENGCSVIEHEDGTGAFVWKGEAYATLPLTLEEPPSDADTAEILSEAGRAALESGKVEVPFRNLAPSGADELWSADCASELIIPLGRAGATRLQKLAFGKGTSQHAIVAGKTGSGKSTLLHVLITAGALWHSPDQLEFYLIDFKKGVEFKAYTGGSLPHARAVAIESDREFGLSVLQRLDDELKRRGDLFRDLGVQSIGACREALAAAGRREAMPRTVLVIDEFQEFFTEDDKIAQDAGLLLDRLVRQGRAFGMHVMLGSQTLSGAYALARSTMGQMAVRIALQCSETDSYLILSEDNAAARLLNRPGEAIYNNANGMVEGNNPFQVCWLPDSERDERLAEIRAALGERPPVIDTHTIVFEGNVPADPSDNQELLAPLAPGAERVRAARAWVGDPVAIKPPTGAHLRRQAGANLVVVGQQDETSRAMLASAMVGLAAQHAPDARSGERGVRIAFLDSTPPDDPQADSVERMVETLGAPGTLDISFGRVRDLGGVLSAFDAERERREAEDSASPRPWYLFLLGLQRFRELRKKDDDFSFSFSGDDDADAGPNAAAQLADLLRDGPALGLHVITWCDTVNNLSRTLDRRGVGCFEQRAVLQMSTGDSANFIDSPDAGKLGMNRGLLYNEELGTLEKFRPYRTPDDALVERVAAALRN